MGAKQIIKLIFLILFVILASAILICGVMLGKNKNIDISQKRTRVLLRIRVCCFLGMLLSLLLVVILT